MSANGGEDAMPEHNLVPAEVEINLPDGPRGLDGPPNPHAPAAVAAPVAPVVQQPQPYPYYHPAPDMWQNYYPQAQPAGNMHYPYMQQQQPANFFQQNYGQAAGPAAHHAAVATPEQQPAEAPKAKRGRPKKRTSTDEDPTYVPPKEEVPSNLPNFPKRSAADVCIADNDRCKCGICAYWTGRYLLSPCFHYSFCIDCMEKNINPKSPKCPVCQTPVSKYVLGYRSTIHDTLSDNDD